MRLLLEERAANAWLIGCRRAEPGNNALWAAGSLCCGQDKHAALINNIGWREAEPIVVREIRQRRADVSVVSYPRLAKNVRLG